MSRNGLRKLSPPKFVGLGGHFALLGSDGQCVFTHCVHGVECDREVRAAWLFFLLVQTEQATVPVGETFSPFINADIRTTSSLLMSPRSVHSSPCTKLRKKEETVMDVTSLVWGTNGKWAAQRAKSGRVKATRGRKTKVRPPAALVKVMCATTRCTSLGCMGLVTRSLFS